MTIICSYRTFIVSYVRGKIYIFDKKWGHVYKSRFQPGSAVLGGFTINPDLVTQTSKALSVNSSQSSQGSQEMETSCQAWNAERTYEDSEHKRNTKNWEPDGCCNKAVVAGNEQEVSMLVFTHQCVFTAQTSELRIEVQWCPLDEWAGMGLSVTIHYANKPKDWKGIHSREQWGCLRRGETKFLSHYAQERERR